MAKRRRSQQIATFAGWVTGLWLPIVRAQLKQSTFDSYERNLRLHVLPRIGSVPLSEITPRALTSMYVELLESGRLNGHRRGLSARTVRYVHAIVHKALADAVDDGLIASNPADRAKAPRTRRSSDFELRFWGPRQLAGFLAYVRGSEFEVLWHLAAFTGMRRGELLGLRWVDVDFDRRRLSVRRNVVLVARRIVETTPKTHQARVIDLDEETIRALVGYRLRREAACAAAKQRLADHDRVFCEGDGSVLHPENVTVRFQSLVVVPMDLADMVRV